MSKRKSRKSRSRSARFRKRVRSLLATDPDMGTKEILASTKRFDLAPSSKRREIGKVKRKQGYEISPRAPVRAKESSVPLREEQLRDWARNHNHPDYFLTRVKDYNTGRGLPPLDEEGILFMSAIYKGKTREQAKLDAMEGTW